MLKDVFKRWSTGSSRWRNEQAGPRADPAVGARAAAVGRAAPDQRDQDSLPPYDVLDAILEGYVEEDHDASELVRRGLPEEDVERVIRLVDRAEYKRRQAPPGIKISTEGVRPRPAAADHEPLRGSRRGQQRRLRALR